MPEVRVVRRHYDGVVLRHPGETYQISGKRSPDNPAFGSSLVYVDGDEGPKGTKGGDDPADYGKHRDRHAALQEAISKLDHENDEHWTGEGLPRIEVVEELFGHDVSRSELNASFPHVIRERTSG